MGFPLPMVRLQALRQRHVGGVRSSDAMPAGGAGVAHQRAQTCQQRVLVVPQAALLLA